MTTPSADRTKPPDQARRIQLDTLTGLRGVLAMTVFLFHGASAFVLAKPISYQIAKYDVGPGQAALTYFFMLSGFVLVWVARPGESSRAFFRRRIVKIFPNHLTTWFVGLGLMIGFNVMTTWWKLLPSLVLIHAWIPLPKVLFNVNGPNWSLSAEMFFYAMFPFLFVRIRRIPPERLWRWVILVGGGIIAWTAFIGLVVPSQPKILDTVSVYQFYILMWFPLSRLFDFALGMLIARVVQTGQWRRVRTRWIVALLLPAWVLSVVLPGPLGYVAPFIPGLVLLIGNAATADLAGSRNFFTRRVIVWMGDVSFAFYLIHNLLLVYGLKAVGGGPLPTPYAIAFLLGVLLLTFVLAHYQRRFIEEPAMRRWSRSRTPAPPRARVDVTS